MGRKVSFLGLILAALLLCQNAEAKFRTDELYVGSGSGFINADTGLIEFTPMADNQIAIATDTGALTVSTIEDCVGSTDALTYNAASHDIGCHAISTIAGWSYSSPNMTFTTSTDNLGIGGTPLGKVSVTGDTDEIQLNVRFNATQTANGFVVEKSDGTDLFTIANDGTQTSGGSATSGMDLGGSVPATYPISFLLSGASDPKITGILAGIKYESTGTVTEDYTDTFSSNTLTRSSSSGINLMVFSGIDVQVPTEVYDSTGWNGDNTVPTKDAVRDKIEALTISTTYGINLPIYSAKISGGYVVRTPTSGDASTQGAQIDAGDGNWRLLFDATTDEAAVWQWKLPPNWTAHGTVKVDYSMASATSGKVEFEVDVMCVTPGDSADIGTASFAGVAVANGTVPGTAGYMAELSVTPTDDSCAAGDMIFFYLSKDADDGTNDTATGDTEVVGLEYQYTGT